MARSRSRSSAGKGAPRAAKGGAKRAAKSKKAAAPAVAEVEGGEEEKGMGIDDGVVLMTTVLLVVAFVMVDYVLGSHYGGKGTGIFGG